MGCNVCLVWHGLQQCSYICNKGAENVIIVVHVMSAVAKWLLIGAFRNMFRPHLSNYILTRLLLSGAIICSLATAVLPLDDEVTTTDHTQLKSTVYAL